MMCIKLSWVFRTPVNVHESRGINWIVPISVEVKQIQITVIVEVCSVHAVGSLRLS